ncbi:hypothetical protein SAMN05444161_2737 [Rhizobiales bacterium GAS191]|nr:hypothetical protein SAMN05444161_2737 [Rhizobiales bacterium GAS191]
MTSKHLIYSCRICQLHPFMNPENRRKLAHRIMIAAQAALKARGYVSPVAAARHIPNFHELMT